MGKIGEFLAKWAFCIVLCLLAVTLLCGFGCCVYTAITNPLVGIIGGIGVFIALGIDASWIYIEIKEGK